MNTESILERARALAPWYYRYDLRGVSTDQFGACDHHGHREPRLPAGIAPFLRGQSVLDVGCNEGGYSFAALDLGASSVHGFDCRDVNVEKAKFVAEVLGKDGATFEVHSADSWLSSTDRAVDYVFLCGLLYHLPEPWRTIRDYSQRANKGVWVTCVLAGGEDGYTELPEAESIAASEKPEDEVSMMPNTSWTLIDEFAKHGFLPAFVSEGRETEFWGACHLFMLRCDQFASWSLGEATGPRRDDIRLFLVPRAVADPGGRAAPFDIEVVIYNRSAEPLAFDGCLMIERDSGVEQVGRQRIELASGLADSSVKVASSHGQSVGVDLGDPVGCRAITVRLEAPGGELLCERSLRC